MKNQYAILKLAARESLALFALMFVGVFFLAGCGSSSNSATTATALAGSCSSGYVYSSTYGCLLQSTCPTGYGMYNNTCVVATSTAGSCSAGYVYSSTYGCLLQSTCPTGYGMYNSTCVVASTSTSAITCPTGYVSNGVTCVISTTATTSVYSCQGTCAAGLTQTAYGCLPQYYCSACYGYAQGYCLPGALATTGAYYLGY